MGPEPVGLTSASGIRRLCTIFSYTLDPFLTLNVLVWTEEKPHQTFMNMMPHAFVLARPSESTILAITYYTAS